MSGSPLAAPQVCLAASRAAPSGRVGLFARLQHLSLDIVAGVVCAAGFAVTITGAAMPLCWWLLLPLATWVVYSADHLLDARRTGAAARQPRHRFYHDRFASLAALTLALLLAGTTAGILWLPGRLLAGGVVAGTAAGLHLVLAQTDGRVLAKEISTAAIYAGGIWFGPLLMAPRFEGWYLVFAVLHLLAALSNLVAFALFEERLDRLEGHASIVRSWGRLATMRLSILLTAIGVAGVLVTAALAPTPRPAAFLVLLVLFGIPAFMVRWHASFAQGQRYRTIGDLAFVLMILPFLLAR